MSVLSSPQIILQLISPNDSSIDPRRATRHELQEVRYPRDSLLPLGMGNELEGSL